MSYVNNAFNGGHEMEERRADSKTTAERMGYEMYNGRAVTENRNSEVNAAASIPRSRVQNEADAYDNEIRNNNDRRQPTSTRHPNQSTHQLRLEEGVSPVQTSRGRKEEYESQDRNRERTGQRNRYRD